MSELGLYESPLQPRLYRQVVPLPYNLAERIRVAFEETLHSQAIELLNAVLFTGISAPDEAHSPAFLPPPSFLRYALTLMVHPFYTSQICKDMPTSTAPVNSYIMMRRIITIIGPMNAGFDKVWRFSRGGRSERRRNKDQDLSPSSEDSISGELANEESLFSRVEDVWSVVGWGFTCSVSHSKRWPWWKNVLECLIMSLENDWWHRWETYNHGECKHASLLEESMIVKMLPDIRGTGGYRRVLRAILATGTGQWANEFHGVWEDELLSQRPKRKGHRGFDSFLGEIDSLKDEKTSINQTLDNPVMTLPREDSEIQDATASTSAASEWGGFDAFILRQRFFSLLSEISNHDQFINFRDLYREFKDYISHCPLRSFKLFITTLIPLDIGYRCVFNQVILETLLGDAPAAERGENSYELTQAILVRRFLPYAGKSQSVLENAKVAVLLEVLTRLLFRAGILVWSQMLQDSVEVGITARWNKVSYKSSNGNIKEDIEAVRLQWKVADDNLRTLVRLAKARYLVQEEGGFVKQ